MGVFEAKREEFFRKFPHKSFDSQTMLAPFSFDYTKSFSSFRKKAETLSVPACVPHPLVCKSIDFASKEIPSNQIALVFKGGESEGLRRLNHYLPLVHDYKSTRDQVDGIDNSTKFSSYLSVGAISARQIYHAIKDYESQTYSSQSSYWIYFELLWRDFFHMVLGQSTNKLFCKKGFQKNNFEYIDQNSKDYQNFFRGNSGVDLIDACIKELTLTGWLSNRNRQLVASYAIKNLGINWLDVAKFFEQYLVDYNPASNYGNCAYQGFVGNDTSYRIFDIYKQSRLYGGKKYIRKWLDKEEKQNCVDLNAQTQWVKANVYKLL